MKEFKTAAREAAGIDDAEEVIEFVVDDETWRAHKPTEGQVAWLMANMTDYVKAEEQAAASINFFVGLFDQETRRIIAHRLMDREDPFDLQQIQEITEYLVEEWSSRPTKSPSDYMPSQQNGGRRSTGSVRRVGSTHSDSPQRAS